jgi:hypothetical protein
MYNNCLLLPFNFQSGLNNVPSLGSYIFLSRCSKHFNVSSVAYLLFEYTLGPYNIKSKYYYHNIFYSSDC